MSNVAKKNKKNKKENKKVAIFWAYVHVNLDHIVEARKKMHFYEKMWDGYKNEKR